MTANNATLKLLVWFIEIWWNFFMIGLLEGEKYFAVLGECNIYHGIICMIFGPPFYTDFFSLHISIIIEILLTPNYPPLRGDTPFGFSIISTKKIASDLLHITWLSQLGGRSTFWGFRLDLVNDFLRFVQTSLLQRSLPPND